MGIKEDFQKRMQERKERKAQERVENDRIKAVERESYLKNKEKYVQVRGAQKAKADVFRPPMGEQALKRIGHLAGRYNKYATGKANKKLTKRERKALRRQQYQTPPHPQSLQQTGGMLTGQSHQSFNPFEGIHNPSPQGSNPFTGIFQPPQRKKKRFGGR